MKGLRAVQTALVALGLAVASWASAQPTDLIISEYVEGSGTSKALEIYNGTGSPVDLSQYSIRSGINGAALGTGVPLTGTLASGSTHVIANAGSAAALLALANQTSTSNVMGFNGDDAIVLEKTGGIVVDSIGVVGVDPGTNWGTSPTTTLDATLRRKATVCAGDTNTTDAFDPATEWNGFPQNTFDGLGSHTLSCAPVVPTLDIAAASEFEGNSGQTPLNFALTLSSAAPAGGLRVLATTSNGTATAGDDYVALTDAEFTIAAGETTANVVVQILGDTTDEPDETLTVSLTLPDGGATFGDSAGSAIGTIRNDDASTSVLSIAPAADVAEGNTGTTPQVFVVSLSGPLPTDVNLTASTSDISATAGQDYVAFSDRAFVIAAGQTSVEIAVDVIGDRVDEANESYRVSIASSSPGVTLGTASAEGVILDDDLPFTEIFDIQGTGLCSPFASPCSPPDIVNGSPVRTASNVVTSINATGFTMQTPDARADADVLTSNGIAVFTSVAPRNDDGELLSIGDLVEVTGRAGEFRSMTQIAVTSTRDSANSIVTEATNQPLPAAIVFGDAPTRGSAPIPSKDPGNLSCGAVGNFECFEGMRVRIADGIVSVSHQRRASDLYAEVWISPYGERGFREKGVLFGGATTPTNAAAGVWDGNPEILEMDADFANTALAGTELAGGVRFSAEGILGVDFFDYEFWPTSMTIEPGSDQLVRPVPVAATGELTIGSFNAFRLCDSVRDNPAPSTIFCSANLAMETDENRVTHERGQVSAYIREVLRSPDVVGLQEVENIGILQALATKIAEDGGPTYSAHLVEGNDVGGIDVGYLVNTARVANITVTQLADAETWNDPGGSATATLHDRPPLLLAAEFLGNGRPFRFHVINNHTRSRGGVDVSNTAGERLRAKRFLQAVSIANLVQNLQSDAATVDIPLFVIGDHNAFQFTDGYVDVVGLVAGTYSNDENTCAPANAVTNCKLDGGANVVSPPLINALDVIDAGERYSYKFTENFGAVQGSTDRDVANVQVLDHGLFNSVAAPFVTGMAYGRANVDASDERFRSCRYFVSAFPGNATLSYNAERCGIALPSFSPVGSSDHDGFVLFVSPPLPDAIFANGFETID